MGAINLQLSAAMFSNISLQICSLLDTRNSKGCYQFAVIRNDVPTNANGCCQITVFCSYAWRMVAINCGSPLLCFSEWVLSTCSFQQQCISKWLLSTCDLHIPCLSKWVLAIVVIRSNVITNCCYQPAFLHYLVY